MKPVSCVEVGKFNMSGFVYWSLRLAHVPGFLFCIKRESRNSKFVLLVQELSVFADDYVFVYRGTFARAERAVLKLREMLDEYHSRTGEPVSVRACNDVPDCVMEVLIC